MPRRDGTGPEGKGPRTGRGLGPCGKGTKKDTGTPRGQGSRQNPKRRSDRGRRST
jgi:hypothetical protein